MNFNEAALKLHEEHHGKIEVTSKVPVKTRDDLSTAYTPGVAEPCRKIHDKERQSSLKSSAALMRSRSVSIRQTPRRSSRQ